MEAYFSTMIEDIRYEGGLILLFSLTHPDILKQSIFTDHELNMIKNPALRKIHRQKC